MSTASLVSSLKPFFGAFTASHFETFKKMHEDDQMAVDKLKEGIQGFAKDQESLEKLIGELKDQGHV